MGRRAPDLHYVPYDQLEGRANVAVDGSPAAGTVLSLSHWPGIGSPAEFAADLSAEMAFLYLGVFDRHDGATAVSNNTARRRPGTPAGSPADAWAVRPGATVSPHA